MLKPALEFAVVIPVRMKSSRFPGKPLARIAQKEMFLHVIDRCSEAVDLDVIYVATDSREISTLASQYGVKTIQTSEDCATGTDRIIQANSIINANYIINVQGDEPSFNPKDILLAIEKMAQGETKVLTGYCMLDDGESPFDPNTIKLVFDDFQRLIYISRSAIPGQKNGSPIKYFRQVCLYGYTSQALREFSSFPRGRLEVIEDHELLRFLENRIPVNVIEMSNWSVPVDIPSDIRLATDKLVSLNLIPHSN
jgi:3-deoxy-manno-octulosonate cytidylyltransferase (CMP-KDO synthetase)